jgi:hypothetical protein
MLVENMPTQAPAISITYMIDPALYAGVEFSEADLPGLVQIKVVFQAAGEVCALFALTPGAAPERSRTDMS